MPGRDRTGPMGTGAMTGGRGGYCANAIGATKQWCGVGRARRLGNGLGLRCRAYGNAGNACIPPDSKTESNFLKNQAEILQQELDSINSKIAQIKESAQESD